MSAPILTVKNLTKDFPGVRALDNVDFDVKTGEVHAVCGENGAGKSTLMHILAGVYKPNSGEITMNGVHVEIAGQKHAHDLGIAIVYQERSLINSLTVAENIFSGKHPLTKIGFIDNKKMNAKSSELLKNLGMDINALSYVQDLSPPEQQMVEIAKALSHNPKVLIFDEPTSVITDAEIESLFAMINLLKARGMAIVYISHRLEEIFDIADRVTVLKDGKYIETASVKDVDIQWLINRMVGRELAFKRWKHEISDEHTLDVECLSGDRYSNVSFYVRKGEIIGFAGLAGAGRTETMRGIFGIDPVKSGKVKVDGKEVKITNPMDAIKHGVGYLPEDRKEQGLFLEMSITENVVSASLPQFTKGINIVRTKMENIALGHVEKLGIVTPSIKQKAVNLSGGNQQKVIIAKWLQVNPRILIVDEPTRGVDVGSKSEIYSILRTLAQNGTSVIFISSELPEVIAMSDRVYVMSAGKINAEIEGDKASEALLLEYAYGHDPAEGEM